MSAEAEQGELGVFVNPALEAQIWPQNSDSFAEEFANWAPDEEACCRFSLTSVPALLKKVEEDDSCFQVKA